MAAEDDQLSTSGHADFIFEVAPDPTVFDTVRREIVDQLEAEYMRVLSGNVREHVRVDTVDIDPVDWAVEGKLDAGYDVGFTVTVPADSDATSDVLAFLRDAIDDRYGPHVDSDVVVFDRVGLRPRAWFVDAKIPPSVDGVAVPSTPDG